MVLFEYFPPILLEVNLYYVICLITIDLHQSLENRFCEICLQLQGQFSFCS